MRNNKTNTIKKRVTTYKTIGQVSN